MGRNLQNLTHRRFGSWEVIGPSESRTGGTFWYCRCDCGAESWVKAGHLVYDKSKGCRKCSQTKSLAGQRFGLWEVQNEHKSDNAHTYWLCRCKCGTEKWVRAGNLKSGASTSCGCNHKGRRKEDLIGKRFGVLEVVGPSIIDSQNRICWCCRCLICGAEKWADAVLLKRGKIKNCGTQHSREEISAARTESYAKNLAQDSAK